MKIVQGLSLKGKLFFISIISLIILILVGFNSSIGLMRIEEETRNITDVSVPHNEIISSLDVNFRSLRIELRTLGLPGISNEQKDATIKNIYKYIAEFEANEAKLLKLGFIAQDKEQFGLLQNEWAGFKKLGGRILELANSNREEDQKELVRIFLNDCPQYAERVNKIIIGLTDYYLNQTNQFILKNKEVSSATSNLNLVLVVVGVLLCAILNYFFVGFLVKKFNEINQTLHGSVEVVHLASSKISESSSSLGSSTAQQNSAILQVSSSTEQLKIMTERNLASVNTAEKITRESFEMVRDGQKTFEKMIQSVNEISKANDEAKLVMEKSNVDLSTIILAIQDISEKTKVINEIVFQTKLLSFNASVEAARAGEHGRGFSIVAEEIGKLAEMSGRASDEISKMLAVSIDEIGKITNEMREGLNLSITNSSQRVQEGMAVSKECGNLFSRILLNMEKINQLTNEISTASKEQFVGVAEVDKAILNIDESAKETSEISNESSKLSDDLYQSVLHLNKSIVDLKGIVFGDKEVA